MRRFNSAWKAAADALELVAAERKAAKLPAPVIRGFGPVPPATLAEATAFLNPKPYRSSAHGEIHRLERLRRERIEQDSFETVRVLSGGVPGEVEKIPRRPRGQARAEEAAR